MLTTTLTTTSATQTPSVTVLVCTRDRGESIVMTIRSILACTYPNVRLLIIDQSSDRCTEQAIKGFRDDSRLQYIHTRLRGKSRAENLALSFITTDLVLLTDDDCEVPPDWISQMVEPFVRYPKVGVVFCNVIAAPHDSQAGFVPDCVSSRSFLVEDLAHWQTSDGLNIGIGAGMAIRREAAEMIDGFSLLFGPGSPFRSGDDTDFTLRALVAGYQVYRTHTTDIIHHGFRTYDQGRKLIRNNMFGLGGIYGQLLRHGHFFALWRYASVFMVMVIMPALNEMAHLRPPRVLGRIKWLICGLIKGLLTESPKPTYGMCETHEVDDIVELYQWG
ncbi:glycosyltransferase family 2 protein [Chloroflexales bacterium ZM16-3]|nr:glycosyltransferase family 2 protein [Chloroflexales bacterium ZM16-3]